MRINRIIPEAPVRPVSRMKTTYITLPIHAEVHEEVAPAPLWMQLFAPVAIVAMAIVAMLWA
jgi:hypothetical protein